jgi:ribonuclease P protein component
VDTRLPRGARVRTRADYDRIFAAGRRSTDGVLAVHWLAGSDPARLGLAVSRRVDPRATARNRIKRVLRAEFRALRAALAPGAYVLVARAQAATIAATQLRMALRAHLLRLGALPPSSAAGTMPAALPSATTAPRVARRPDPPVR